MCHRGAAGEEGSIAVVMLRHLTKKITPEQTITQLEQRITLSVFSDNSYQTLIYQSVVPQLRPSY